MCVTFRLPNLPWAFESLVSSFHNKNNVPKYTFTIIHPIKSYYLFWQVRPNPIELLRRLTTDHRTDVERGTPLPSNH